MFVYMKHKHDATQNTEMFWVDLKNETTLQKHKYYQVVLV